MWRCKRSGNWTSRPEGQRAFSRIALDGYVYAVDEFVPVRRPSAWLRKHDSIRVRPDCRRVVTRLLL